MSCPAPATPPTVAAATTGVAAAAATTSAASAIAPTFRTPNPRLERFAQDLPRMDKVASATNARMHEIGSHPDNCGSCWLLRRHCVCADPSVAADASAELASLLRVYVYTHPRELVSQRGSNTGKWIIRQGGRRILVGQMAEEEELVSALAASQPFGAVILLPTANSMTTTEYVAFRQKRFAAASAAAAAAAASSSSSPESSAPASIWSPEGRPVVVLLDSTWSSARGMLRRLSLLLELRGYHDIFADTAVFPSAVSVPSSSSSSLSSTSSSAADECAAALHPLYIPRVRLAGRARAHVGSLRAIGTNNSQTLYSVSKTTGLPTAQPVPTHPAEASTTATAPAEGPGIDLSQDVGEDAGGGKDKDATATDSDAVVTVKTNSLYAFLTCIEEIFLSATAASPSSSSSTESNSAAATAGADSEPVVLAALVTPPSALVSAAERVTSVLYGTLRGALEAYHVQTKLSKGGLLTAASEARVTEALAAVEREREARRAEKELRKAGQREERRRRQREGEGGGSGEQSHEMGMPAEGSKRIHVDLPTRADSHAS